MTKDNEKFYYNVQEYHEKRYIIILYNYTLVDDVIIRYTNDITVGNSSKMATLRQLKEMKKVKKK